MNKPIFSTDQRKKKTKKWLFFPVSLVFHGIILAAVVVAPLLNAGSSLPPLKVQNVYVISPPEAPPPPPAPPKKQTSTRAKRKPERQVERRPVSTGRILAPIEIPTEVIPEDINDFGFDEGSPYGVEGGVEGGVVGGVVGGILGDASDTSNMQELRLTQVQKPKLIKRVQPQYPQMALRARIQGVVIVEAVTDIYGRVVKAKVVSGHALLRNAALQAVQQWVYEPYIISGIPKPVMFTVTVTFSLSNQ